MSIKTVNCYFGHHKCASTWIIKLVYDICALTGQRVFEKQSILIPSLRETITSRNTDFYVCQTSVYEKICTIKNYRGFHVIRDPRDIITSGYFSHLYSHKTDGWNSLYQHRQQLKKVSKDEGILKEIEFSSYFIDHIMDWNYNDPDILEIKMEDLIVNTKVELIRILNHLNLFDENQPYGLLEYKIIELINRLLRKTVHKNMPVKLNSKIVSSIVEKNTFEKMTGGRKVSKENVKSHYRKGISGDWKNHFKEIHLNFFENTYPGLIEKLGYEIGQTPN